MQLSDRQSQILAMIRAAGRAMVDDLATSFQTTPQTIRKDLQTLAEAHQVVRFHGGAALLGGIEYMPFAHRSTLASVQKEAIGAAIARLIPPNATVFINTGTTTERAALALRRHTGLRVIIDNVRIANDIRNFGGMEVMTPGGVVRGSDGAITGPAAVDFVKQFRMDYAIIGVAAIDDAGTLLDFDFQEAQVARAMIQNARHVILAADSTKFHASAPVSIGDMTSVHTFVTDKMHDAKRRAMVEACDVEVIEAC